MRLYVDILGLLPGSDLKGKRGTKSLAAPFFSRGDMNVILQVSSHFTVADRRSHHREDYRTMAAAPACRLLSQTSSPEVKYYLVYFTYILFMPRGFLSHEADLILIYFFTITVTVGTVRIAVMPA